MNETLNIFGTTYSNVKGLRAHGTSQEIMYTFLRDSDITPTFSGNVITVSDTTDSLGGVVRSIDAVDISDSTITADTIKTGYVGYTAGGVRVLGNMTDHVSGQTVYVSGNGLNYTPTFILHVEDSEIFAALGEYGAMEHLIDLTITGVIRHNSAGTVAQNEQLFSLTNCPNLKRLTIAPNETRSSNGSVNNRSDFNFGHYAFSNTNLRELTLGKLEGMYFTGAGYFRNDCPVPPGKNNVSIGGLDGLRLTIYTDQYRDIAGFYGGNVTNNVASNTIITQYDYLTGEELTA